MSITLAQLLAGIRQVESGGRYGVVNSVQPISKQGAGERL